MIKHRTTDKRPGPRREEGAAARLNREAAAGARDGDDIVRAVLNKLQPEVAEGADLRGYGIRDGVSGLGGSTGRAGARWDCKDADLANGGLGSCEGDPGTAEAALRAM